MVAMNVWPTDASDGSVANEARWRKMARGWTPTAINSAGLGPTLAFPNLTIKAGTAWVDGHYCELASDQVLTVTANGLVVVRFDPAANTAELLYRDGATTPNQNAAGVYEMPVAKMVGSAMQDMRASVDKSGRLWANSAAALELSFPSGSWNAPLFGTEAFVPIGLNPHVTFRYLNTWQELPSLYVWVGQVTTDTYGRFAIYLPTGGKSKGGTCQMVNTGPTVSFIMGDTNMGPIGAQALWFDAVKHDGTALASTLITVQAMVSFTYT